MSLGLKQKFTMLAILSGIVAAIIAGVGYYVSYQNLSATIEGEMNTVIGKGRFCPVPCQYSQRYRRH